MAQKNATPRKEQQQAIKRAGLRSHHWTVIQELRRSLIIRNRITGEVKLIGK